MTSKGHNYIKKNNARKLKTIITPTILSFTLPLFFHRGHKVVLLCYLVFDFLCFHTFVTVHLSLICLDCSLITPSSPVS